MVLGKTHPRFDYHKFFKTYPEAFKLIYRLRDFMKYRIVEWDNKDPSDPIKRMELELKAEKKQAISTQEQRERPVNEQQGNSIKVPMDIYLHLRTKQLLQKYKWIEWLSFHSFSIKLTNICMHSTEPKQ